MKALILAIKKLISVIIAILIPAAPVVPNVTPQPSTQQDSTVIEEKAPESSESFDIVEENPTNTQDPATQEPETPAAQDPAAQETTTPAAEDPAVKDEPGTEPTEEFVPVQTWDVSATEDDNVTMAFYDTDDTDALLAQLAGKITALFTPMVALAADVEIFYEDGEFVKDKDFGPDGQPAEPEYYTQGTVVVYGEGDMQDYVYNNFVSVRKYVEAVEKAILTYYAEDLGTPITVTPEYDTTITDVVELDSNIVWHIDGTNEEVYISEGIKARLNPADMLEYSPKALIIKDGVRNISDQAFVMCSNITKVVIPETVVEIGTYAFGYCDNLTEVTLPESLEVINSYAFAECRKLKEVVIPQNIQYIGLEAFSNLAEGATLICPDERVAELAKQGIDKNVTVVIAE